MKQDRFVRVMLVVIAALLAANLFKSGGSMNALDIASRGTAQVVKGVGDTARTFDVKPVRGYKVAQLKDVVVLGDQKSFVVSNNDGFMVYSLDAFNQPISQFQQ